MPDSSPHSELLKRATGVLSVTPMDEWDTTSELLYQVTGYAQNLEEQLEAANRRLARYDAMMSPPRPGWLDPNPAKESDA